MEQAERAQLSVVMFPWLAHGHINPFLELARRLTSADSRHDVHVVVHLVSTPVNLAAIAHRQTDKLRLVALPDLPPALHTTKHLPPRLMPLLKRACDLATPRFGSLLDELRPDVLLYDFLQPWAPLEAAARGVPAAHFSTCSAAVTAFFVHCLSADRAPRAFPFEAINLGTADEEAKYTELFAMRDDGTALVAERDRLLLSLARSSEFVAVKTWAEIEQTYMDYLSKLTGKDIIPCGPLLVDYSGDGAGEPADRVMRWLDGHDPGSVLLVSFGSEYFMSEQQIAQMARGLELSGERFVWVVVGRWAPQRRILSHPACGAFLTHCGWSSVMEAQGVPIVALPLHIDQPPSANLAAELGAATRVPQERFGEFRGREGRDGEAPREGAAGGGGAS